MVLRKMVFVIKACIYHETSMVKQYSSVHVLIAHLMNSFLNLLAFSFTASSGVYVEPITEERANRCLGRIDLLCKIREQILHNPLLEERLKLCRPSSEMPEWWICGLHDKDLLMGAARCSNILHKFFSKQIASVELILQDGKVLSKL